MDMSDNSAPSEGGKKVIILCEKVSKEDIKVRFFDYSGWEEWAEFGASGVHKQYAISLTVPRYSDITIIYCPSLYNHSKNLKLKRRFITVLHAESSVIKFFFARKV